MFLNNLKIAWRAIGKNRIYTFINILGLTVGVAAVLLIYRMVNYELSFNKDFQNYDRIGRVVSVVNNPAEGESHNVCTPIPAMDVMENTVGQFEQMSRVRELWSTITIPNPSGGSPLKKFGMARQETAFFVEGSFLQIFDFQWLAGNPNAALNEPNTIVLSKSWAEKCFDNWEKAPGQTILLDNLVPAVVKGVIEDLPDNCDFTFPFLVSYQTVKNNADLFFFDDGSWGSCSSNNQVYALLRDPSLLDAASLVLAKVGEEEYNENSDGRTKRHELQPLSDLHFDERYGHSGTHTISKSRLNILSAIGVLILIMACFNFINLATAQSSLRAKEVGVRKTLGGRRGQLIGQFMSETGMIVFIAVLLGVNLASMSAPLLKHVSDVPDAQPFFSNPVIWVFILLMALLVTLLAGLYPALTLAGFQPVRALKSNISNNAFGGAGLRRSLVVLQFVIAQGLIVGAIITIMQLDYIQSRDLGFSKDLVYHFGFNADSTSVARQDALKQQLLQIPTVEAVSLSSDQPLSGNTWSSNFRYASRPEDEQFGINLKFCDKDYQEAYGIKLLAGKWLTQSDTMREAVVNMTLLRKLGLPNPAEVVGQNIRLGSRRMLKIVGVTADFHTHSLRLEHEPLLMSTRKEYYWEAGLKIRPDDIAATTSAINRVFDKVMPEQVFTGGFLDDSIAEFYEDDSRLSATCRGFGLLAIFISCLGLFGLATHAAAQRIKEIGIRKVLGATTSSIVTMLSKDFVLLVLVAAVIAAPLAWVLMSQWLDNFVFRINITWWVFVLAGVIAVGIAFLTVGYQGVRAALANPVKSLRSE